jgi:hypothetical protein
VVPPETGITVSIRAERIVECAVSGIALLLRKCIEIGHGED